MNDDNPKKKYEALQHQPSKQTTDVEYNVSETAGGSNIPDPDNIPGNVAGTGEDIQDDINQAKQTEDIGKELQAEQQKGE